MVGVEAPTTAVATLAAGVTGSVLGGGAPRADVTTTGVIRNGSSVAACSATESDEPHAKKTITRVNAAMDAH